MADKARPGVREPKRRAAVLTLLEEQGVPPDDLRARIQGAATLAILEDLYLPFRPKRRMRGSAAREKGLEPLAASLLRQGPQGPEIAATAFVDPARGVVDAEEALSSGH